MKNLFFIGVAVGVIGIILFFSFRAKNTGREDLSTLEKLEFVTSLVEPCTTGIIDDGQIVKVVAIPPDTIHGDSNWNSTSCHSDKCCEKPI